jgi:branched-chain amino acid transport system substrate-binding protein
VALLGAPSLLAACGSDHAARAGGSAPIRIGYVTPTTGSLAAYAAADDFTVATVRELIEDGLETRHGTYSAEILVADSASDPARAAAVAGDLMDAGVALVLVAATAETVNPVADACETRGVPCLSTMVPWQTWFFGRKGNPNAPFGSTFHFFWGIEDLAVTYLDMWDAVRTDRTVGLLRPSAGPGFAAAVRRAGYRFVDASDAQIVTGDPTAAELAAFVAAGPLPPVVTVGSSPASEPPAQNISTEAWWTPDVPFISSLKGWSAAELAGAYRDATGRRWTPPLGSVHALFEVALDVLKQADPRRRESIVAAIRATDLPTVVGPVSWRDGPVVNVARTELAGAQWRGGDDGWDLELVSNKAAPDIATTSTMERIG